MDSFFSIKRVLALGLACTVVLVRPAFAFELLSEGAMDSVSAVSAGSAEDLLNIAGPTAAGLRVDDDYESLPFQVDVQVDVLDVDEVSEDLDFAFTQEVELWATELRRQGDYDFEVGVAESVTPSDFEGVFEFVVPLQEDQFSIFDGGDGEDLIFEIGRIEQAITLQNSGLDTISVSIERFIERASTTDSRTFADRTIGNGYLTNIRSSSNVTLTAIRD